MGISYNKVILVGRLTADPEISYANSGTQIGKFLLAVDRKFKAGNQSQDADFFRITTFGKLADVVGNYLSKGSLIMVEGRIQINKYQAKDGTNRYSTDIIAGTINFMETKKQARKNQKPEMTLSDQAGEMQSGKEPENDAPDEDVPF